MAVLPIVTFGDPVLQKKAKPVLSDDPELQACIDDLFETMYEAAGVGLAAPQVGKSIRLFVVDADAVTESEDGIKLGRGVFINPVIEPVGDETWDSEEGCLSIPDVRDQVTRPKKIYIRYYDRNFQFHEEEHEGWYARVLQHEMDHLNGILFIDYLGAFRKRLLRSKLENIRLGKVETEYLVATRE
ncbi:MAG: peptide deformylase [Balneolales bacterium]